MAVTEQQKIHFIATEGPIIEGESNIRGSNAIIIQDYKDGKYVYAMIDVGYRGDGEKLRQYLSLHKIKELEFVLITHYHTDHYSNLINLLTGQYSTPPVKIKKLILPMTQARLDQVKNKLSSKAYTNASNALERILGWRDRYKAHHNSSIQTVYFGDVSATAMGEACSIGKGTFTFYNTNPTTSSYGTAPSVIPDTDEHNWTIDKFSIVTVYEVQGKRILIPSDIYELSENLMLARDIEDCDVIQMSHHGSHKGNSQTFIDFVVPDNKPCAAIQLRRGLQPPGEDNRHWGAIQRYLDKNNNHPLVRVYGTWQPFKEIWGTNASLDDIASIVLEIRDGNIRYCTRRFVNTEKGYDQRTIPESAEHNIVLG